MSRKPNDAQTLLRVFLALTNEGLSVKQANRVIEKLLSEGVSFVEEEKE